MRLFLPAGPEVDLTFAFLSSFALLSQSGILGFTSWRINNERKAWQTLPSSVYEEEVDETI